MDPATDGEEEPDEREGITLPVGKNASLTLATDSLIVLGRSSLFLFVSQLR